MPRSMIAYYSVDYLNEWVDPQPVKAPAEKPLKFRISVGGGISNLIGRDPNNIPDAFIPYLQELRSGWHLRADFTAYVNKNVGLGVKYSMFRTKNQLDNVFFIDSAGTFVYGLLEDDITIHFVGPCLSLRKTTRSGTDLVSNLAFGALTYRNDAAYIYKYLLTGNTVGFSGDIGFDFEVGGRLLFHHIPLRNVGTWLSLNFWIRLQPGVINKMNSSLMALSNEVWHSHF